MPYQDLNRSGLWVAQDRGKGDRDLSTDDLSNYEFQFTQAKLRSMPRISLAMITQILGLMGVLMYAILWISYEHFYSVLDIRVEEIGLDYRALVARSLGAVLVILFLIAITGLLHLIAWITGSYAKKHTVRHAGRVRLQFLLSMVIFSTFASFILGFLAAVGLSRMMGEAARLPDIVAMIGFVGPAVLTFYIAISQSERQRLFLAYSLTLSLIWSIALPSYALLRTADELAVLANFGSPIASYAIQGIPVLDVQATPVRVQWIGPVTSRPLELDDSKGFHFYRYVGQAGNTVILRVCTVPRLPNAKSPTDCPPNIFAWHTARIPLASISIRHIYATQDFYRDPYTPPPSCPHTTEFAC
jgi:hypothetical protein